MIVKGQIAKGQIAKGQIAKGQIAKGQGRTAKAAPLFAKGIRPNWQVDCPVAKILSRE